MITHFKPDITYLDRYINDGYLNKFSTFLFMGFENIGKYTSDDKTKIETWRIPVSSLFTDYWYIIGGNSDLVTTMDLSEKPQLLNKYRYNPKVLSYDLYDTVELWQGLLEINNVKSMTEFDFEVIKVFYKDRIFKILETLLIMSGRIKEDTI